MFPKVPQSSLGILRVPQLPAFPLNTPPLRILEIGFTPHTFEGLFGGGEEFSDPAPSQNLRVFGFWFVKHKLCEGLWLLWDKSRKILQGELLPITNGVMGPVSMALLLGNWGYKRWKWSYNHTYKS